MAGTGSAPGSSSPNSDDINDRLAEIAAELASEAKFKEPAAADRLRAPVRQVGAGGGTGTRGSTPRPRLAGPVRAWRNRRRAAELRQPVRQPGRPANTPPSPAGRRASGPAARRAVSSPAPDRGHASSSERRPAGRPAFAVLLMLVLAIGVALSLRKVVDSQSASAPTASATAPGQRSPAAATPSPAPPFSATDPFAGSPAAAYADGAAGIVLPAARPVGQFSGAQVAAAYATVSDMLIAANLNWPTIDGHTPAALGRLLLSQQRSWFYDHLTTPIRPKKGTPWLTRRWVTSFPPGTQVVGRIIKVHGEPMTAKAVTASQRPALRIEADYIFVYAVQQPDVPASRLRIVAQEFATVEFAQWTDPGGSLQPWVFQFGDSYAGAQCGTADGFVHPSFPALGPGGVPSGKPVNPYQLGLRPTGSCQLTTGT